MPDRPKPIDRYTFTPQDHLFFDTNVWVFLFGSHYRPPNSQEALYSIAFKKIRESGCRIVIDAIVLSEFVNRLARLAYHHLPSSKRPREFKDYRKSTAFRPVAKAIADACRRILAVSTPVESEFASLDLSAIFAQFESGRCDFNDHLLAALCGHRGFILVTHDSDFRGKNIPILTANSRLLR